MTTFTVNNCWLNGWLGATTIAVDDAGFHLATSDDPAPLGHIEGTVLPGFRDHHVHLGLADGTGLLDGGIAAVDDFGWDLDTARGWSHQEGLPEVTFAGQLLTAPGGYPTESGWAPRDSACEVAGPNEAAAAVDRQLDAGAGFIKVALNADVGPVFDGDTLAAVVGRAHERGFHVAAHAQGAGQAERALDAGVDLLAHAPWSERLSDELITAMAASMRWVSTLDIHGWGNYGEDFAVASDNVRRFCAAGGEIRYGTDLGNGPLPLGINERELRALEEAGLEREALIGAIATRDIVRATTAGSFGLHLSHIATDDRDSTADWLATARLISPFTIREHLT